MPYDPETNRYTFDGVEGKTVESIYFVKEDGDIYVNVVFTDHTDLEIVIASSIRVRNARTTKNFDRTIREYEISAP